MPVEGKSPGVAKIHWDLNSGRSKLLSRIMDKTARFTVAEVGSSIRVRPHKVLHCASGSKSQSLLRRRYGNIQTLSEVREMDLHFAWCRGSRHGARTDRHGRFCRDDGESTPSRMPILFRETTIVYTAWRPPMRSDLLVGKEEVWTGSGSVEGLRCGWRAQGHSGWDLQIDITRASIIGTRRWRTPQ